MANNTDAFVPELWAAEAVNQLWENMIFAGTVHRDFENELAAYGDVVNTRKPGSFTAKRKQNDLDDVEIQDVTATNIQVKLNQRVYVAFMLGDKAQSLSFQDLVQIYLSQAIMANARHLDRVIGAQVYQFLNNTAGGLGQMTKVNSHEYLLDMRQVFNDNYVPTMDRWMALCSKTETLMQKNDLFKQAYSIGDSGQALRNAILGRVDGWNTFLEMNTASVRVASDATATATVNGAHAAGVTVLNVDDATDITAGMYIVVAGDWTPVKVLSKAVNALTLNRPLKNAVADNAVITKLTLTNIDQSSAIAAGDDGVLGVANGYPAGWLKQINVNATAIPRVGQLVSFGATSTVEYGIIDVAVNGADYYITLDRPLEEAIAHNGVVCLGPAGDYNFAYQRNAVALVSRPLLVPRAETGVRAATAVAHNMALRVEISRNSLKQGHLVVVDGIFGVAKLDAALGGCLLG
jgi:hypothetical protein